MNSNRRSSSEMELTVLLCTAVILLSSRAAFWLLIQQHVHPTVLAQCWPAYVQHVTVEALAA